MSYQSGGGYQYQNTNTNSSTGIPSSSHSNQYEYSNVPSSDDTTGNVPVDNANSVNSANGANVSQQQQQQQQQHGYTSTPITINSSSPYTPRAYLPTYHEYMQSTTGTSTSMNANHFDNINSYGPPHSSSSSSSSMLYYFESQRRSRRNKLIIGCVALFIFFFISHSGSSNNNNHANTINTDNTDTSIHSAVGGTIESNTGSTDDDNNKTNVNDNHEITATSTTTSTATPTITYLLSYPMSGTTFAMELIQKATNMPIATNNDRFNAYHSEGGEVRSISNDYPNLLSSSSSSSYNDNNNSNYMYRIGYPFWTQSYESFIKNNNNNNSNNNNSNNISSSLPSNTVLTLSHCAGFCMAPCTPFEYTFTFSSFEESCRQIISHDNESLLTSDNHTNNNDNESENENTTETTTETTSTTDTKLKYYIPKNQINGIIHLIRDPLSNVVSRFHEYMNMNPNAIQELHSKYPNSSGSGGVGGTTTEVERTMEENFQLFCHDMDTNERLLQEEMNTNLLSTEIKSMMKQKITTTTNNNNNNNLNINAIPCASEFIKLVQWHNFVVEMSESDILSIVDEGVSSSNGSSGSSSTTGITSSNGVNAIQVYFEDFSTNINQEVANMATFLDYSFTTTNLPTFLGGKLYHEGYYTDEQMEALKTFIQTLAYSKTWDLLKRYF